MLPVKQLAELKVTEWLLAGIPYENMPAPADDLVCNSGGRTAWFRRHVRHFVEQELAVKSGAKTISPILNAKLSGPNGPQEKQR